MRSAVLLLMVAYAVIGLVFFGTSLYLYLSGTDNKRIWRLNNIIIWLVVLLGLALVVGSLFITLTGRTLS